MSRYEIVRCSVCNSLWHAYVEEEPWVCWYCKNPDSDQAAYKREVIDRKEFINKDKEWKKK